MNHFQLRMKLITTLPKSAENHPKVLMECSDERVSRWILEWPWTICPLIVKELAIQSAHFHPKSPGRSVPPPRCRPPPQRHPRSQPSPFQLSTDQSVPCPCPSATPSPDTFLKIS